MHTNTFFGPCHTVDLHPLLDSDEKGHLVLFTELEAVHGIQYVLKKHLWVHKNTLLVSF